MFKDLKNYEMMKKEETMKIEQATFENFWK